MQNFRFLNNVEVGNADDIAIAKQLDSDPVFIVNGKAQIEGNIIHNDIITYTDSSVTTISTTNCVESEMVDGVLTDVPYYKLQEGYHALSNGPIVIADGITVKIPDNTQWKII